MKPRPTKPENTKVINYPPVEIYNYWRNFDGIEFLTFRFDKTVYSEYNFLHLVIFNFAFDLLFKRK